MRASRRSGSKVITDPGELGPDLLELLVERLVRRFGHAASVAEAYAGAGGALQSLVLLEGGGAGTRIRVLAASVWPAAFVTSISSW